MKSNVSCKYSVGDRSKNEDKEKIAANGSRIYIIDDKVNVPGIVLW